MNEWYFISAFLFWLTGGIFSTIIRLSDFSEIYTGFNVDYGDYWKIFPDYILFIFIFILSLILIRNRKLSNNYINKKRGIAFIISVYTTFLLAISYFIITGSNIFSGDYYSRFTQNVNLLMNILPRVLCIISIDLISDNNLIKFKKNKLYIILILISALLISLSGSRSALFYTGMALISYWFITYDNESKDIPGNVLIWRIGKLLLLFALIYILGQFFNILRWLGTDITLAKSVVAVLGDFFPEYRTHARAFDYMYGNPAYPAYTFGLSDWLLNLATYIFPGPIFSIFGLDRSTEFNSLWKNFFEPIFWQGNDALFGLRTGLVGEISLALGRSMLIPFAFIYALAFRLLKSKIIVTTCLVGTIPYGATAIYMLIYCLIFKFVINFISGNTRIKW